MEPSTSRFRWTVQRERAARMVAQGGHTSAAIAAELGVMPYIVSNWRRRPRVPRPCRGYLAAAREAAQHAVVADVVGRVGCLGAGRAEGGR